jgi:hypothetical protein
MEFFCNVGYRPHVTYFSEAATPGVVCPITLDQAKRIKEKLVEVMGDAEMTKFWKHEEEEEMKPHTQVWVEVHSGFILLKDYRPIPERIRSRTEILAIIRAEMRAELGLYIPPFGQPQHRTAAGRRPSPQTRRTAGIHYWACPRHQRGRALVHSNRRYRGRGENG